MYQLTPALITEGVRCLLNSARPPVVSARCPIGAGTLGIEAKRRPSFNGDLRGRCAEGQDTLCELSGGLKSVVTIRGTCLAYEVSYSDGDIAHVGVELLKANVWGERQHFVQDDSQGIEVTAMVNSPHV